MNKRLPLIYTLLAVIALSASVAYWVMELYKPAQRPLAAMPQASLPDPAPEAGATLFGGQAVSAVASNYQLTGVIASGANGVAILLADGQPAKAVQVGREISPGVLLKDVQPRYVMLSEGGILKRIELATDDKAGSAIGLAPPTADQYQPPQPVQQPMPVPQAPVQTSVPVPNNGGPMEVPEQVQTPQALPPGVPPPPPAPADMPRPTRSFSNTGNQPPNQ